MLFALGAASSAIDALKALTSSKSSSTKSGLTQNAASPFDFSSSTATSAGSSAPFGGGSGSKISPETMNALLAAQSQFSTGSTASASASPSDALKHLFSQIDANGNGKITESEFENALGAGGTNLPQADDVFSKLDKDGDGSVSVDEMSSALKGAGGRGGHHHHHHVASSDGSGDASDSGDLKSDPLMQLIAATSTTAVTNSDGSTTTTLTFADGSSATVTSLAASTAQASISSASNNFLQMIQRQAHAISTSATASLSVSA